MNESDNWLTPKEAAKLLGCTSKHITNQFKRGKLAYTKEDGRYYIDKSEFFRVFPEAHKKERARKEDGIEQENERILMQKEMLEQTILMQNKEIEFLRSQIETLNEKESKVLSIVDSQMKLLEYKVEKHNKTETKGWFKIFKRNT